ncbi:MAG TPA: L-glyceraldehyde 3-phosphate reductase, partial [Acinetobacter sp.]|nr:L-glyceraldehyde 3-phosphate reductase [Acinetobacter sp.]
ALAWVLRGDRVTSVLIGASKTSQIDDAVGMLQNRSFTQQELDDYAQKHQLL